MKVKVVYVDSFTQQSCEEVVEVPEYTGEHIAAAMQARMLDETGLPHTYTSNVFEVVNERENIALFHIKYAECDSIIKSDLTGTAFPFAK